MKFNSRNNNSVKPGIWINNDHKVDVKSLIERGAIDKRLIEYINTFPEEIQKQVVVTSAIREGNYKSRHSKGLALDLRIHNKDNAYLDPVYQYLINDPDRKGKFTVLDPYHGVEHIHITPNLNNTEDDFDFGYGKNWNHYLSKNKTAQEKFQVALASGAFPTNSNPYSWNPNSTATSPNSESTETHDHNHETLEIPNVNTQFPENPNFKFLSEMQELMQKVEKVEDPKVLEDEKTKELLAKQDFRNRAASFIEEYLTFNPTYADYSGNPQQQNTQQTQQIPEQSSWYMRDGGTYNPEYEAMSNILTQRNKNIDWVDRALNPDKYPVDNQNEFTDEDGKIISHKLAYGTGDNGEAYVYPTVIYRDGKLIQLSDNEAMENSFREGQSIMIPNIELAEYYSQNGLIKHKNGGVMKYPNGGEKPVNNTPIPLKEATATAKKPQWSKFAEEFQKENPLNKYIDNRFKNPVGREVIKKINKKGWEEELKKEYAQKMQDYVAEKLIESKPKPGDSWTDNLNWYNSFSEKERSILTQSSSKDKFLPAERAYRRDVSEQAKRYGFIETFTDPDKLSETMTGTPDRFRIFPNAQNNIEDWVNPGIWLGEMAKGLGNTPKNIQEGDYGQAALSVLMPLGMGAIGGIGARSTSQFVNNLVNPVAGAGDLVNNLGNKYLPNAYKLNPWAFKPNPEAYYRGIGKEGMEDALQSGVFRPKNAAATKKQFITESGEVFEFGKSFDKTYYSPDFKIADRYGKGFIAEVPQNSAAFNRRYSNKDWSYHTESQIPIDQGRVLQKDWLKGYKEIPKPTSSVDDVSRGFKSEIGNIDYRKNPLSDKEKEMYQWFDEQMRFDKLPQTTNKQSIEVLDNFKQRIRTPEGQKRLKELGITEEQLLQDLKIVEDPNTYGYYRGEKNTIAINPNHPLPKKVVRHEIEHGVQNALRKSKINKVINGTPAEKLKALESTTTEIDDILSGLTLRREGTPNKVWGKNNTNETVDINNYKSLINNKQNATDYFLTGSDGAEKSAFLGEVQQYMMDTGKIPKDSYVEITPEMVKETMVDAMFDEAGGGRYLRLFNIIKADPKNYELISKGLNKMLTISPLIGAASQSLKEDDAPKSLDQRIGRDAYKNLFNN
jgi:hypothetical protein